MSFFDLVPGMESRRNSIAGSVTTATDCVTPQSSDAPFYPLEASESSDTCFFEESMASQDQTDFTHIDLDSFLIPDNNDGTILMNQHEKYEQDSFNFFDSDAFINFDNSLQSATKPILS